MVRWASGNEAAWMDAAGDLVSGPTFSLSFFVLLSSNVKASTGYAKSHHSTPLAPECATLAVLC